MIKRLIGGCLVGAMTISIVWADHITKNDSSWNDPSKYNWEDHLAYIQKVERAMGTFKDIKVWDRSSADEPWELINGAYIPITVDGKTPNKYTKNMKSDRPMVLPIHVEGFTGGDGQSMPYSVVGRMAGSNPETQWVFLVRKYFLKDPMDADFVDAGDVAIIGHHPRTGESTYFQFYDPNNPKSAQTVISPFSNDNKDGMLFWSPLVTQAEVFQCQRCHNNDAFIHTPWIDQVRVSEPTKDRPNPEPMVPSNPLGNFSFVASDDGEAFNFWNDWLVHLDDSQNKCTECHRVAPYDLGGFYQTSTKFVGVAPKDINTFAKDYHDGQTDAFKNLPWMPPVNDGDFYAGQTVVDRIWENTYKDSAIEVNELKRDQTTKLRQVPRPPKRYREIIVDRPNHDPLAAGSVMWIVDTRMRANTDGKLAQWRFYGNSNAGSGMLAAPVVLERVYDNPSNETFKIAFIGEPRPYQAADTWSSIDNSGAYDLRQGDYLGLMLINNGNASAEGLIPFTNDTWSQLSWPDGTTKYVDGLVTHKLIQTDMASVGDILTFEETAYQTYSFELKNKD